jgi:hypothetical protein
MTGTAAAFLAACSAASVAFRGTPLPESSHEEAAMVCGSTSLDQLQHAMAEVAQQAALTCALHATQEAPARTEVMLDLRVCMPPFLTMRRASCLAWLLAGQPPAPTQDCKSSWLEQPQVLREAASLIGNLWGEALLGIRMILAPTGHSSPALSLLL